MTTNELAGLAFGKPAPQPEPPRKAASRGEIVLWLSTFLTILGLLFVWEIAVRWLRVPTYLFPAPSSIFERMLTGAPFFATNALTTLMEALAGFALGSAVALVLATLIVH